jgi:hypothetical protein
MFGANSGKISAEISADFRLHWIFSTSIWNWLKFRTSPDFNKIITPFKFQPIPY